MVTDPIADLLTRMRNAFSAKRDKTMAPCSKVNLSVLEVLKNHDFIKDYKKVKSGHFGEIEITLNTERITLNLKRVSRPGQRVYVKKSDIKPVRNRYGISLLSTPKGVMTGDEARKAGVGGEYLCQAW